MQSLSSATSPQQSQSQLRLHVLSRADIHRPQSYQQWSDPDQIAPIAAAKLKTMLDNPLNGPDSEPAQIIGTSGQRVIGRIDLIPGEILISGQPERIFYGSNLIVPEEYRKSLMGVMLILKSQSLHHTVAAFGPSQIARQVYEKLKWADIELPRFILIRNSRPVIERYYGNRPGLGLLSSIVSTALAAHRTILRLWNRRRLGRLHWKRVDSMPDKLESQLSGSGKTVACHRSARWINWLLHHRFTDDPRNDQILLLVRDLHEQIVAYALLKIRFHETATHRQFKNVLLGSLQDWMIFDAAAIEFHDIVLVAMRELLGRGVDAIEIVPSDFESNQSLRRLGFARVGSMHMMFRAVAPSLLADPTLHRREQWFIRPGDGENFFV